jgi:hypothetical protein
LHGLLKGCGNGGLLNWNDAKWLLVAIKEWIDLDGKVKFPEGRVVYCGNRQEATEILRKHYPLHPIVGVAYTDLEASHVIGGDYCNITGGIYSTVTGGDYSKVTGGNYSTVTGGVGSKAKAGEGSTITLAYCNGRLRWKTGYIGEDLKPNIFYKLNKKFEFEKTK